MPQESRLEQPSNKPILTGVNAAYHYRLVIDQLLLFASSSLWPAYQTALPQNKGRLPSGIFRQYRAVASAVRTLVISLYRPSRVNAAASGLPIVNKKYHCSQPRWSRHQCAFCVADCYMYEG